MRTLALLFLFIALGLGLFLLLGKSSPMMDALESGAQEEPTLTPPRGELPAAGRQPSPAEMQPNASERLRVQEQQLPKEQTNSPESTNVPVQDPEPGTMSLIGNLTLPTGKSIKVSKVRAELRSESGQVLSFDRLDTREIRFSNLRHEPYELQLEVPDYTHRLRTFDFRQKDEQVNPSQEIITERIVLWPEDWIPVVLSTPDGLPIHTLAVELGWAQKNLLLGAFDVRVSRTLAGTGDPLPALNPELATFHPPPGSRSTQLLRGVIGSLELHGNLPLWAGLWIRDRTDQSKVLQVGATELHFEIGLDAMDASMASVTMRVLDKETKAPALDVEATLKADTSSHRRKDLARHQPTDAGQLAFRRVIPGHHELTLLREGQIIQRRLTLEAGENLDLGDILIGSGPGLQIRVESSPGKGVKATIEIAPYETGHWVKQIYPPNLHRNSNRDGEYVAPLSQFPWILRVRVKPVDLGVPAEADGHGGLLGHSWESYPQIASRNYLIDPNALPQEIRILAALELRLLVEPQGTTSSGQWISFEDEHGLLVAITAVEEHRKMHVNLVPGNYTARRWNASCQSGTSGLTELGALPVLVTAQMSSIRCP